MPQTIWKYPLAVTTIQHVTLPVNAQLLSVERQGDGVCLWAQVDPLEMGRVVREVHIYGTGHPLEDTPKTFLGTVMLYGGTLVFHVFEAHPLARGKETP